MTSLSLCEMKMIDEALGHELAAARRTGLDLLRRQHRGRLVEDQDARVAIERLQDLDALALADGEAATTRRSGSHVEAEILASSAGEPSRAPRRSSTAERAASVPSTMFSSTREVLGEREMLVHHADAGVERGMRRSPGRQAAGPATSIEPSSAT